MREQKLLACLLISLTVHTALLAFVPSLLTHPASSLKRPLWVDLVDLKDPSGLAPSLPPSASAPEASSQEPARKSPRQTVSSRKTNETGPSPQETLEPPIPYPRPLPSARELIPTMNSLLAHHGTYDNPLHVEPSEDEGSRLHRGPQYEAYLRDVKEAVRQNWKVSGEGESKRGTTVLRISINPDGSLGSLDLLQSSGMILHDYEALEAIKQSFPLRAPPESLLDEHGKLSIRFSFHYFLAPPG